MIRNDPFREHIVNKRWSGVLIEPIPWVFEKLKMNYNVSKQELNFINCAISCNNENYINLYTFKEKFSDKLPMSKRVTLQQKTSFDKESVIKYAPDENVVEKIVVPAYSITTICEKYSIKYDLDLLAIDAEGLDSEIIMSIDFCIVKPKVIFFEHHMLGKKHDALMDFLSANGYVMEKLGDWDTVAELTLQAI